MRTLKEVLDYNIPGLHYGNRILLPFVADILKAVVDKEIIMDFATEQAEAHYTKHPEFTELYFCNFKNLEEVVSKYENIKLIVVEKGKDLFDFSNHKRLVLHLQEKHKIKIEETNDEILFIE